MILEVKYLGFRPFKPIYMQNTQSKFLCDKIKVVEMNFSISKSYKKDRLSLEYLAKTLDLLSS